MIIRPEESGDKTSVFQVVEAAFPTSQEARLVDELRVAGCTFLSLVAESEGAIVGHVLMTPVTLEDEPTSMILGLAPLSVIPQRQGCGIGSLLMDAAIEAAGRSGAAAIVLLGHPSFYRRFGFSTAAERGFTTTFDVPDEYFMIRVLDVSLLSSRGGTLRYHQAFDGF
jgi:putative acetyltransferase